MEKFIKTVQGRIVGKVKIDENGNKALYDAFGKLMGKYDATRDVTTDSLGIAVMQGDGLMAMRSSLEMLLDEKRKNR